MTAPAPGLFVGNRLTFNSPLSDDRADRIIRALADCGPRTIVDYGCGWGELMLRIVDRLPEATATGIDTEGSDLERGRATAAARGLGDRATFMDVPGNSYATPADLVISVGAYQAFGTVSEALRELRTRVSPGGRLLFGAEFWEQIPPPERIARLWDGTTTDECVELPEMVDAAVEVGFRPLWIETSTRSEWESFESGHASEVEEWLLSHGDHPDVDVVREKLDKQRSIWLRGHRDYLGFAILTLGVPA